MFDCYLHLVELFSLDIFNFFISVNCRTTVCCDKYSCRLPELRRLYFRSNISIVQMEMLRYYFCYSVGH